jgi:hypothetical protein
MSDAAAAPRNRRTGALADCGLAEVLTGKSFLE